MFCKQGDFPSSLCFLSTSSISHLIAEITCLLLQKYPFRCSKKIHRGYFETIVFGNKVDIDVIMQQNLL
jgi:hypothetical protein